MSGGLLEKKRPPTASKTISTRANFALVAMLGGGALLESSAAAPSGLTPPTTIVRPGTTAPPADYEANTRPDRIGRIIVPITVNGHGPFQFLLDTGANRTVLTPRLVAELGLQISRDDTVTLNGVTGAEVVPTVFIERVSAGDLAIENQRLPVAYALGGDVDGVLGVDGLGNKRVLVDFVHHKLEIRASRSAVALADVTRTRTRFEFGLLMIATGHVGPVRVNAVIDTGSEYTLGNSALRNALNWREEATQSNTTEVIGQTLTKQLGLQHVVRDVVVADTRTHYVNVVFGDFYMFKLWDLDKDPTLVIGMDLMGGLDTLVIDYGRREVQFRSRKLQ
jgi:predicted aspartyl protease